MIIIKSPEEIEKLREGGKRLARLIADVSGLAKPGVSALELDLFIQDKIKELVLYSISEDYFEARRSIGVQVG